MVERRWADVRGQRDDGSVTAIGATSDNDLRVAPITGVTIVGGETLTVSTTSIPLASIPGAADYAYIDAQAATSRYRFSGVPTATAGHLLETGDVLELESKSELTSIRFIRRDGVDVTLEVTYGRRL